MECGDSWNRRDEKENPRCSEPQCERRKNSGSEKLKTVRRASRRLVASSGREIGTLSFNLSERPGGFGRAGLAVNFGERPASRELGSSKWDSRISDGRADIAARLFRSSHRRGEVGISRRSDVFRSPAIGELGEFGFGLRVVVLR